MASNTRQTGRFLPDLVSSLAYYRIWTFMAVNDLRARFARSRLGFAWIIVSFAVWAFGVGVVYAQLFELKAVDFVPFLTVGFALWGYIVSSIVDSGGAFIISAGYVKQFNLPKQVYVWRLILSQLMTLGMTLLICAIVVMWFRPSAFANVAYMLPGLALLVCACILQAFLSAYLTPYVRDLPHAASSALNVIFFLTPIIFPPQLLKTRHLDFLIAVNPFYYLIEGVREPLLSGGLADPSVYVGAGVYVLILLAMAWTICSALDCRVVYAI